MYQHIDVPQPKWDAKQQKWILSIMIEGRRKQFVSRKPKLPGKQECRARCIEWIESGMLDIENLSVARVFELFLEDYQKKHGENEQVRHLISIGKHYILPALGARKCSRVTLSDWQDIINNARPIPRTRADGSTYYQCKTLSKKYLKNIKGVISSFISWAAPRRYMEYIPTSQLYIPTGAPTVGKDILQISDIEKLFTEPTGLWYERALMLEVLSGLRPGEIIALQKNDYNPVTGALTIRRAINARGKITPGKNANAHRVIELAPEVRHILEEQLEETEYLDSEWIFCNQIGAAANQRDVYRCWKRIVARKGLPEKTTPYSLRHTFYTHTEAYLPDRVIKSIFGHSSSTDGHGIYGNHSINEEAHEAAERLSITPLYQATQKNKKAE